MDRKVISIYMGNPDNSNHAELELPATPWELLDALDKLRLEDGQQLYWQVEDMGRYEFLAPHLDGYDLYQFNALAEKLRTFGDVDAVAFEGLVQMELDKLWQNNGGDLTLRRVLDLAYSVDCCHVAPGITNDAALGQFYVENDFLPDLATVPDSVLKMLDYEKIGRSMREGEGGVLTPHGYVMQESELRQAPSNLGMPREMTVVQVADALAGLFDAASQLVSALLEACRMPCCKNCDSDVREFDLDAVPAPIRKLLLDSGCCPALLECYLEEGDVVYAAE